MKAVLSLLATLLALAGAVPASAQTNPLVGVWSTTLTDTANRPIGTVFVRYGADGSLVQQLNTQWSAITQSGAGTVTYYGVYQFDAASSTVQFRMDRIDPPQLCDGVTCYPTPPIMPMGQVLSTQLQFVQPNLYVVQDASGPLRFIKQP
jgi:hypothetical protein